MDDYEGMIMTEHLIDHRYTVLEIERMRQATDGLVFPKSFFSGIYYGPNTAERERKTECQLQTYMMAGIRPEELESLVKEREEKAWHEFEQFSFKQKEEK